MRGDFVAALCVDGNRLASEDFAAELDSWMSRGATRIVFVVGGSLGLSPACSRAPTRGYRLSDMTFPHQLARVLLLEQVYRAFKILNNETYHK
jgi:23S rRNA (pseudouridine1915-N3)-methyltransferase